MADLDLSDAFDDAFEDEIKIIKRIPELDDEGRWDKKEMGSFLVQAVVQPNGGAKTTGALENEYIVKSLLIYIKKWPLYTNNNLTTADLIEWDNNRYKVNSVEKFSHFGAGFTKVIAELENASYGTE